MFQRALAICFMAIVQASVSAAGDLSAAPDVPGCDFMFTGAVEVGDAQKIESKVAPSSQGTTLCFDSPGGSYAEGIRMFHTIWNKDSIETRVRRGNSCLSACALAFQGGSRVVGTGLIRAKFATIEPGARLGFHAPTLALPAKRQYSSETVKDAYDKAILGASQLFMLSRIEEHGARGMSDFLYSRTLATPPDSMYEIDTIGKANLSGVGLRNVPMPELSWRGIRNVCETALIMIDSGVLEIEGIAAAFRAFGDLGDDGTGQPITPEERSWSWSTDFNSNFVVRGYPAPHVNERFCKVTLNRSVLRREMDLPPEQRNASTHWLKVTFWEDAYVPNDRTFSQYAEANTRVDEEVFVPWTALWDPMTPLEHFLQ